MNLPVSHILPDSAFRHISLMIGFMMVLAGLSLIGFLNIYHITSGWIQDIDHSFSIEIPAYDLKTKDVLSPEAMKQNLQKLQNYLQDDPLIQNIDVIRPGPMHIDNSDPIPAPIFVTLSLSKDRADNAENRLKNNIERIIPQIFIPEKSNHVKSIERTAMILKTAFLAMAFFIIIVTMMMTSAIIKTLLKAHESTIKLVHLLGAPSGKIADLFKQALTKATFWGLFVGTLLSLGLALMASIMMKLHDIHTQFIIGLIIINLGFLVLTRLTTHWTVLRSLRGMP